MLARVFNFLASLGMGLICLSCARFEPKPIAPAESAARLEERTLEAPELRVFLEKNLGREFTNWPAATWDFDMLMLAAFYYHPSLELARAQWTTAQGGIKTAAGRPNPTVNFGPGYDSVAAKGVSPWIPFVNFDVTVETAGKRGLRMEHGRLVAEAARLNIAATAWQARSNARTALLNFTATQRRALLLRDQTAAQEKILALLEQRLQAGALTSSELSFSRINLHRIRLDTLDAERLHVEAEGQLAEAIGVPVKAVEGIKLSADPLASTKMPEELTTSDVRRQALLTRADILSALADYAASQAALRLEIAKQYPDFHINPGYQWDQGESKWQLGLTVELPLLNRNQGPIAEAEARRAEAAARFNAVQAKVMAEVDRTVAVFRITEKNADLLQSLAAAQTRQREAVQAQVQAGAADQLDLLNAQFDYGNAELGRLDGQMRLAQAVGALEDAVQRPLGIPQGIIEMEPSHAP